MAQLVEQRIRNAWVAGSSPAIGSYTPSGVRIPHSGSFFYKAELAQLVEHWLPKPRVAGSSPVIRSPQKEKNKEKVKKTSQKFAGFKK